jgi:hypothetical protein
MEHEIVTDGELIESILGVGCCGVDLTHDIRLFFCAGNEVLRMLFFRLMVLGCGTEEDLCRTGVCGCSVCSWALWRVTDISDRVDLSMLSFSHVIMSCSSIGATGEKQARKRSSLS